MAGHEGSRFVRCAVRGKKGGGVVTPLRSGRGRLVLSLFPGIDIFGRGFEEEGFTVVRGPDPIFGGDIRNFHGFKMNNLSGIIGGPPCQDFSRARRGVPPTGYGLEMLREFCRCVEEFGPEWFLMENVPTVPTVTVPGYVTQRIDLDASQCGLKQRRLRHFQFGHTSKRLVIARGSVTGSGSELQPTCLASEGKRGSKRRDFPEFCALQGLPPDFDLPGFNMAYKYQAVGNGVPVPMSRLLARAILEAVSWWEMPLCACGCGRPVTGKQVLALAACRKRMQRKRDAAGVGSIISVTISQGILLPEGKAVAPEGSPPLPCPSVTIQPKPSPDVVAA